jgi:hypothetical protein
MKASLLAMLGCAWSAAAFSAPPPAPFIIAAVTDIRQLEFAWEPVPGVQRYELWFGLADGAQWVKYTEQSAQRAPRFRIGVPVHLLDWEFARYYVRACNPSGCTASNIATVSRQQLAAIGYFKPKAPTGHRFFGSAVAAAADGRSFAVLASETMGTASLSATVHVYRKYTSSSDWRREARLVPSTVQSATGQPYIGDPLAISGDGNVIALGAWMERVSTPTGTHDRGAVYLFRRTGTTWAQLQKIPGQGQFSDRFGYAVKLDESGRTLVVSHEWPRSGYAPGTLEIYRDEPNDGSDQFVHTATVPPPPPPPGASSMNCECIALSGDGRRMLRACNTTDGPGSYAQVLEGPAWIETARLHSYPVQGVALDYDGTTALTETDFGAHVFQLGSTGWEYENTLSSISGQQSFQRPGIALSRDGKIAALGNAGEYTPGLGPLFPPYGFGDENEPSGGVIIYERKASGWNMRRIVKPGSLHVGSAGHAVALGSNGRLLIVGAPDDPSAATGINGDPHDASAPSRGAVWVY